MTNTSTLFAAIAMTVALAACGGGGGGGSTGGSSTMPPTPTVTTTPSTTIAGKVVQLAGPLAANGTPIAQSTPVAGAGIGGATVYVVAATGAALAAPTTTPIATVTTAPDGSFSVTVANPSNATQFGLVAMNGTTVGTNGVTNLGFTLAHAIVTKGTNARLYLDTLTTNEQSGFTAYNAARTSAGLAAVVSDTAAVMTARLAIVVNEATSACSGDQSASTQFLTFGGASIGGATVAAPQATTPFYSTWTTQISFAQQANLDFAGFAGPVIGGPACPSSGSSLPQNYFAEVLVIG